MRLITPSQNQFDLPGRISACLFLDETVEQSEKVGPADPSRRCSAEILTTHEGKRIGHVRQPFPNSVRGGVPNLRDQTKNALPGKLVAGVRDHPQVRDDILNVCLLEEPYAAANAIGDAPPGQL